MVKAIEIRQSNIQKTEIINNILKKKLKKKISKNGEKCPQFKGIELCSIFRPY